MRGTIHAPQTGNPARTPVFVHLLVIVCYGKRSGLALSSPSCLQLIAHPCFPSRLSASYLVMLRTPHECQGKRSSMLHNTRAPPFRPPPPPLPPRAHAFRPFPPSLRPSPTWQPSCRTPRRPPFIRVFFPHPVSTIWLPFTSTIVEFLGIATRRVRCWCRRRSTPRPRCGRQETGRS